METKLLDHYITKEILKPNYRFHDVEGAPFNIGDHVKVLDNPNDDSTFNMVYSGKTGIIHYFEYDCGCGQSFPEDPMIGVKFSDYTIGEFWHEELKLQK